MCNLDGKGHKMFAPVFSMGMSTLILSNNPSLIISDDLKLTVLLATGLSILTCALPDDDLLALKPREIIMGTARQRYSNKYKRDLFYIKCSNEEFEDKYKKLSKKDLRYEKNNTGTGYYIYYSKQGCKNVVQMINALFLKSIGIKKHRGWQSHSPFLWIPILSLITIAFYTLPEIGIYLGTILMGFSLGITSHFVGDAMTKGGIELLPSSIMKKLSKFIKKNLFRNRNNFFTRLVNKLNKFQPFKNVKIAKSGSKSWTICVCMVFILVFLYIIAPNIFNLLVEFVKKIIGIFMQIIYSIFKFIGSIM